MRFEFATATQIIFGSGVLNEIGAHAGTLGRHACVVTGRTAERAAPLLALLEAAGIAAMPFTVALEPTTAMIRTGVTAARAAGCDLVIGFGGGSVIDAGKAIAALLTNPGDPLDYLEVIGRGHVLTAPPAPYIAIPTTAGTGAEVTKNAVLASPEHRVKVSLRSRLMLPRLALVDPELTHSLPPEVTAGTGLDALTQVLEPYVSPRANPISDALCREGLMRAAEALPRAYHDGHDAAARSDMALASLFGGLALANAGLGAVHGFAGVLGGMFDAPHGAICGRLLPFVMEANIEALRERAPESPALERYADIAAILTGKFNAKPEDGVDWVGDLCIHLDVPGLAAYGITATAIPTIIEHAARASSMRGNPLPLTEAELRTIVRHAL